MPGASRAWARDLGGEATPEQGRHPRADPGGQSDLGPGETEDPILRGRLRLLQPRRGPRVTTDPILLAHFVLRTAGVRPRRAVDLGAGSGVLALVLAAMDERVTVLGLEIQPALAALGRRAAARNGLEDRVRLETADLRIAAPRPGGYDLAVTNPPYHAPGRGRPAALPARARAHHALDASLEDLAAATRRLLAPRGQLALIYPAEQWAEVAAVLGAVGLRPRQLRLVHPRAGRPAARLLLLAQRDVRSACLCHPPLFLHQGEGWSEEAAAILEGRW